jgi:hypothetical protein
VAAIIGLVFVGLSLRVAEEAATDGAISAKAVATQAGAAMEANKTATDSLHRSQRPWVSVVDANVPVVALGEADDQSVTYLIKVTLFNSGASLARNGFAMPVIVPNERIGETWQSECIMARMAREQGQRKGEGFILAPNDRTVIHATWVQILRDNYNKYWLTNQSSVMGCIIYTDQFGIDHHTRFRFVRRKQPGDADFTFSRFGRYEDAD